MSKDMYIDKLDDTVNECKNTYQRTIRIKPVDVKNNTYVNTGYKVNEKEPKFKFDDNAKI